ncbi:MAG: DnaD domain protein [Dehalococcoidales bacterium]|nr:DnaD domain protein [Dehalococcoidales bacterium]
MKEFQGFPARMEFTSIPNVFFSSLLPRITDMAELKTTLHVIAVLYRKKGHPRYVSCGELLANTGLMDGLKAIGGSPEEALRRALKMAAERGTFIRLALDKDGDSEDVYFLNSVSDRQTVAKIESGELKLAGLKASRQTYVETGELPDIFTLYEQNIGMLTPMIADELRDAENQYPQDWIRDAIKEAVLHNKRSIKYIAKILENWSVEGRSDGTYQRDSKKTDPDRFIKGKYGHMVQR